ncbi:MAG: thiamine phosphate synthase [Alphaproteobacteria bacterium]
MRFDGAYGFYPIVDTVAWLEKLLPLGIQTIQLRIKDLPPEQIEAEIKAAIAYSKIFDCQLVINDYWEHAIKYDAKYLHLGQEDLAAADLAAIRNANIELGISTHSEDELANAQRHNPAYIALGPVFPTTTKDMPWKPQGTENVKRWKQKISCPLVAIGGLNLERAPAILKTGAESIAVITDITKHPFPEKRVAAWLALFKDHSPA